MNTEEKLTVEAPQSLGSEQLSTLLEVSTLLNTIHDLNELLPKVMDIALAPVQAERGLIVLLEGDAFRVAVATSVHGDESDLLEYSKSIVNRAIAGEGPILTHDAQTDPRFSGAQSVIMQRITSVLCVPLQVKDEIVGAIYLDSRLNRTKFTPASLDLLKTLANISAIAIENARLVQGLSLENIRLQSEIERTYSFSGIIGQHERIKEIFTLMNKVKDSTIAVLIEGESGTGKELVARALHYSSIRRNKPFLAQFCGNLSENLLESELFGHKRGSFTGAFQDKKGLLEVADGGTFFLDEIADISPTIQAKLLRVIQDGIVRRVGDTAERKVDVRIISASNKNLKKEVEKGTFREDLFYRLNVVNIWMPALRERRTDIPLLVNHFLTKLAERTGEKTPRQVSAEAMKQLTMYDWPGNVRELENTIERAYILSTGPKILPEDLSLPEPTADGEFRPKTMKDYTREILERTLHECSGNRTRAAEILDVSLRWLHYKINEWDIKL